MVTAALEKQPSIKAPQITCPDGGQCAANNTCCLDSQATAYLCCPLPNAVCCSDGQHCCPIGYACDVGANTCTPVKTVCPDQSLCPLGTTCCPNTSGGYGCCPGLSAVCCADRVHCCPQGYTCDLVNNMCTRGSSSLSASMSEIALFPNKKRPAIKIN